MNFEIDTVTYRGVLSMWIFNTVVLKHSMSIFNPQKCAVVRLHQETMYTYTHIEQYKNVQCNANNFNHYNVSITIKK